MASVASIWSGGGLEREGGLELRHLRAVLGVRVALLQLALGVELEQLLGHVPDGLPGPPLDLGPGRSAQLVQGRRHAPFRRHVALDQVGPLQADVEPAAVGVAQLDHFLLVAAHGQGAEAFELADAVVQVHHPVAGLQVPQVRQEGGGAAAPGRRGQGLAPEHFPLGEHQQPGLLQVDPGGQGQVGAPAAGLGAVRHRQLVFPQDLPQAVAHARGGPGQEHPVPGEGQVLQVFRQFPKAALELPDRLGQEGHRGLRLPLGEGQGRAAGVLGQEPVVEVRAHHSAPAQHGQARLDPRPVPAPPPPRPTGAPGASAGRGAPSGPAGPWAGPAAGRTAPRRGSGRGWPGGSGGRPGRPRAPGCGRPGPPPPPGGGTPSPRSPSNRGYRVTPSRHGRRSGAGCPGRTG